jgi:hypothetical protein
MEQSNFKPREIIGFTYIDGKRVTVLKMGVKRKRYNDDIDPNVLEPHLNQQLIDLKKWEMYHKIILGEDDFENN